MTETITAKYGRQAFDQHGITLEPGWQEDGRLLLDDDGEPITDWKICGHCGRHWNDALITGRTPAPSGRCPFEGSHEYEDDDA